MKLYTIKVKEFNQYKSDQSNTYKIWVLRCNDNTINNTKTVIDISHLSNNQ